MEMTTHIMQEVIERTTHKAVAYAKQTARVDTGDLRQSIEGRIGQLEGYVASDSDHAIDQEYGKPNRNNTALPPNQPPANQPGGYTYNPFMRPAAEFASSEAEIKKSVDAAMVRFK